MTQREKLVELIEDSINKWDFYLYHFDDERLYNDASEEKKKSFEEFISDYLLENGVIVPPCKVGDTVYRLMPKYDILGGKTGKYKVSANVVVKQPMFGDDRYNEFTDDDIGKTVFLTKEEAEKALEERMADNATY